MTKKTQGSKSQSSYKDTSSKMRITIMLRPDHNTKLDIISKKTLLSRSAIIEKSFEDFIKKYEAGLLV